MTNTVISLMNNFSTSLTNDITNSATTFDLDDVSGIATALTLGDYIPMTIDDGTNVEIIHVTSLASSTVTCSRGQEGTSGTAFLAGSTIECRLTVNTVNHSSEWTPVSMQVLTGTAGSVNFTSLPSGDLKVVVSNATIDTDAQDLQFQQGTGGGPTYQTTTYYHGGQYDAYATSLTANHGSNVSQVTLMPSCSNSSLNTINGEFEIANPSDSGIRHVCTWRFRQQSKNSFGSGIRDSTEAITALKFTLASGNFNSGSKFILYKRAH